MKLPREVRLIRLDLGLKVRHEAAWIGEFAEPLAIDSDTLFRFTQLPLGKRQTDEATHPGHLSNMYCIVKRSNSEGPSGE
jgi:hypothetical protein